MKVRGPISVRDHIGGTRSATVWSAFCEGGRWVESILIQLWQGSDVSMI
jgi:hypothetical protein